MRTHCGARLDAVYRRKMTVDNLRVISPNILLIRMMKNNNLAKVASADSGMAKLINELDRLGAKLYAFLGSITNEAEYLIDSSHF